MVRVLSRSLSGQQQPIASAQFGAILPSEQTVPCAYVDDRIFRSTLGLAVEEVGNSRYSVELECLVRIELQFHSLFQNPSTMFLDGFMHGVGREIELAGPFDEPLFALDLLEERWIIQYFEDPV